MAEVGQEPRAQGPKEIIQKGEEESLDKGSDGEEFSAALPDEEARAFEGEFGFRKADRDFDLPAAVVSEHDAPSVLDIGNWFLGDQIPGFAAFARARNYQSEGEVREIRHTYRQKNDAGFAFTTAAGIINHAMIHRTFAPRALPGFEMAAIWGDQFVVFLPAHNETDLKEDHPTQPGGSSEATIPQVNNRSPPPLSHF
jgi:hypothetical protein